MPRGHFDKTHLRGRKRCDRTCDCGRCAVCVHRRCNWASDQRKRIAEDKRRALAGELGYLPQQGRSKQPKSTLLLTVIPAPITEVPAEPEPSTFTPLKTIDDYAREVGERLTLLRSMPDLDFTEP